jgi:predicted TIM-barrel fold metal-dependent hydrolase
MTDHRLLAQTSLAEERVLLISVDSHCSPPIEVFRPYCPKNYMEEFDDFVVAVNNERESTDLVRTALLIKADAEVPEGTAELVQPWLDNELIHYDPHVALRHMDEEGVAAETFYHGAQNGHRIPFVSSLGFGSTEPAANGSRSAELAAAGIRMFNRWLGDFCSVSPHRLVGVAQFPIWDVELAVQEVEFVRSLGLRALNFPAPRKSIPDYNELLWEPLWSAVESHQMTLNTHGASNFAVFDMASYTGVDGQYLMAHELVQFSRRAVPFMIFGGVFERYPRLRLVLTEQPSEWVETELRNLDELWGWNRFKPVTPYPPSHYFHENCFLGVSFMSNAEALASVRQGIDENVMWGRDYPHIEGTWPNTRLSLRMALRDVPDDSLRRIVGLNAARVYGHDLKELQKVASNVGPTIQELRLPVRDDDIPTSARLLSRAFRSGTSWT